MTLQFITILGIPRIKSYGAIKGPFNFIIAYDEKTRYGWVASVSDDTSDEVRYIDNSLEVPFKTRAQAEAACRRELKRLMN